MLKWYVIIFIISFTQASAQKQVVLIKGNTVFHRYSEGEQIRLKRNDTEYVFRGTITGISQKFFKLDDQDTIYLDQIKSIDIRKLPDSRIRAGNGAKLLIVGAIVLVIDVFNGSGTDVGLAIISGAAVVAGTAIILNNYQFKPGRKRKVIVMG